MSRPRRKHREHSALRVVRGVLLASASAALATTAHALADGAVPNPSLTVALTALIGWTSTALADRTRGLPGILAVLAPAQVVLHVVLTELGEHAAAHGGGAAPSPPMAAAHASAVLGTAVLLARAEALLLVVVASLRLLLPVAWSPAPVPGGPVRPVSTHPELPAGALPAFLRTVLGRRGPPVAA